jgi:oxygen-dependent protoporphyrinogen oxidase
MRHLTRQIDAMPQYHVGHNDRLANIKRRLQTLPTLVLAGSSLSGVGVPGCIESGQQAAQQIVTALQDGSLRKLAKA